MAVRQRAILGIVFLLAFFSCFNRFTRCFSINSDKAAQLEATKNFSEGLGLTLESVDIHNLSLAERRPIVGWPPGYSFLLMTINPMTHDYILSTNILNVFFLLVYLSVCYLILVALNIQFGAIVLFFVFTAVTNQPMMSLTTTDLIAFDVFLLMFYILLLEFKGTKFSWQTCLLLGVMGFISVIIKYNFLPLVFLIPLTSIVIGQVTRNKRTIYAGILCGLVMLVLTSSFLIFQKINSGHFTYLSAYEQATRYYFENLQKQSPFFFEFLFVRDPFKFFSGELPWVIKSIPFLATGILLLLLCILLVRVITEVCRNRSLTINQFSFVFGCIVIGTNVAMLFYLSITSPPQNGVGGWTYVEEFRYYAPACFFFFIFLLAIFSSGTLWYRRAALTILVTSIGFGAFNKMHRTKAYGFGAVFDKNQIDLTGEKSDQIVLLQAVTKIVNDDSSTRVVYSDATSNQRLMSLAGAHIIWEFDQLLSLDSLYASSPSTILISLSEGYADQQIDKFLKKNSFRKIQINENVRLFRRDLN